jgi:hypothetical protein
MAMKTTPPLSHTLDILLSILLITTTLSVVVKAAPQHHQQQQQHLPTLRQQQQHPYDTQQQSSFIKNNVSKSHHPSRHNANNANLNDHPGSGTHRHMSSNTVLTSTGPLRGLKRTVNDKDVHVYYGVPFAKVS